MAATELSTGYLSVALAFDGQAAAKGMDKLLSGLQGKAKDSGKAMGESLGGGVEQGVTRAQADINRLQSSFDKAAQASKKASAAQESAADRVAVAQAKLNDMAKKGTAGEEQRVRAQAQLRSALRQQEAAVDRVRMAEAKQEGALKELAAAQKDVADEGEKSAKRVEKGWRAAIARIGSKLPLSGMSRQAGDAGDKAGRSFSQNFTDEARKGVGKLDLKSMVAGGVGGLAVGLGSSLGGAISGGISGAMAQVDSNQTFAKSLEFAKIPAGQIRQLSAATQDYADKTVYDLGEIRNTTASFAASGVKGAQSFTEAIGNLNAVAGGTSETFGSVTQASAQIMGAGKLTTENWNQVRDAIPGGAAVVKKALAEAGAYTGDFSKAMEKGEISAEEYQKAIEKVGSTDVAKKAASSATTFSGAWGNMQATIEGGLAKTLSAIQPLVTGAMNALSPLLENGFGALGRGIEHVISVGGRWAKQIKDGWYFGSDSTEIAQTFFTRIGSAISDIQIAWGQVKEGFTFGTEESRIVTPFTKIGSAIGDLKIRWDAFKDGFTGQDTQALEGSLIARMAGYGAASRKALESLWDVLQNKVWPAAVGTFGFIARHQTTFGAIATGVLAMVGAFKVYRGVMTAVRVATMLYSGAQAILNAVMSANPIGIVVLALVGLAAGLVYAYKHSETFRRIVNNAWSSVKNGASSAWNFMRDRVLAPMGRFFTQTIPNAAKAMGRGIAGMWDGIKSKASGVWTSIRDKTLTPMKNFFTQTIPSAGRSMRDALRGVWDNIKSKMNTILTWVGGTFKQGWSNLKYNLTHPVELARDTLKKVFDSIKAAADRMADGVKSAFDKVKGATAKPVNFVIDKVHNNGLVGMVNNIPGASKLKKAIRIPGFQGGGLLPGRWSAANRDPLLGVTSSGIPHVRVEPEEFVTKRDSTKKSMRLLTAINAGQITDRVFDKLRGLAGGGYVNPVPGRGNRHSSGYPWATWAGDFPVPTGTPIKAWKDGVVAMVKYLTTSYGKHTRINHSDGSSSLYAHQSSIKVSPGQKVSMGDIIGLVGSTGNSTGPHLHFETKNGHYAGGSGDAGGGGLSALLGPILGKIKGFLGLTDKAAAMGPWGKIMTSPVKPALEGLSGWASGLLGKIGDTASGAVDWVKSKMGIGSGVERWRGTATEAAKAAGLPLSYVDLLLQRMKVESGGNPNAQNNWDINARNGMPSQGLMQTIPPTFRAYAGQYAGRGIRDPFANIYAAIKYSLSTYGLSGLSRAWGGRKGYDAGGWLQPMDGYQTVFNHSDSPEPVFTGDQWRSIDALAGVGAVSLSGAMSGRLSSSGERQLVLVSGELTLTEESTVMIEGVAQDVVDSNLVGAARRSY